MAALIKTINPQEASGKVKEIYDQFVQQIGFIPNAFQINSTSEFLLRRQAESFGYYMQHPVLKPHFQAIVRLLVSMEKDCEYCVNVNTGILLQAGLSMEQIQATKENPENAPLEEKEIALLKFLLKVVTNSNSTTPEDISLLKEYGWSDSVILEATHQAASQVASDMILNAFKVENEKMG